MPLSNPSRKLVNVQSFNASGTYTPTAGVTAVSVELCGGGGGGGSNGGGGGGRGEMKVVWLENSVPQTITIGGGGGGGSPGGNPGVAGGTTSFGALASALGGGGGAAGNSGAAGTDRAQINIRRLLGSIPNAGAGSGSTGGSGGGYGGGGGNFGGPAGHGSQPGAGGGGCDNVNATGNGAAGYVLVYEYA